MKTLMILGGSGYLGKSFLQYFIDGKLKKYNIKKIILLSRNINKLRKIFNIKSKNVILRKIDLIKAGYLPKADMIIHAAESSIFTKDIKKLKTISNESIKITQNLYKILSTTKKDMSLLYMSSGVVYGPKQKKKKFKESDDISQNKLNKLPPHKKNYAINKLNSEKLFLSLNKKHNIKIARGFTFVGKYLQRDKNYAIGNFLENALIKKDLKVLNNYNTYRISGLPATPICNPSQSAINAAAHPADTNFFYFVLNESGKHLFSETYEEHKKNVILWRNSQSK